MKIGLDPDVKKCGVAILTFGKLHLTNMHLYELNELLHVYHKRYGQALQVIIESGWLISHNFSSSKVTGAAALKIANRTGENHCIGKLIEVFCKKHEINYKLQRPLKKIWKGTGGKITHKEFVTLWAVKKLCGELKQSNQEQRDAALLVI
jgi:hypothetical protein